MADSTVSLSSAAVELFEDVLETAETVPIQVTELLMHHQSFEQLTFTSDTSACEYTLVGIGNGAFLVRSDVGKGWYIDPECGHNSPVVPRIERVTPTDETTVVASEYVFDETGILAGETAVAEYAPTPVRRCDSAIEVTHLTLTNGLGVPYEWHGLTADDIPFYLRARSGTVSASVGGEYGIDGEMIYHAFIGKEFPGTTLLKDEIIATIDAVEYISISSDLPNVPDDRLTDMFETFTETHSNIFTDLSELDTAFPDIFQDD